MFEASLEQGALLKKIVEALKDLISEVNFDVNEQGLSLQAMDSSHVSLVCLELKEDGFVNYRCDRAMSMGMNVLNFGLLLRATGNDDKVTMRAQDDDGIIEFVFEGPGQNRVMDFQMKLMDIQTEQLGVPDQDYAATVVMSSALFTKICRDFAAVGDSLMISIFKGGIRFSTSGDIGTTNYNLMGGGAPDDENSVQIDFHEPVTSSFGLKFLNSFTKAGPLSDKVRIGLSPEIPVMVEYDIKGMGSIKYYLAPKMDDQKEEDMMD